MNERVVRRERQKWNNNILHVFCTQSALHECYLSFCMTYFNFVHHMKKILVEAHYLKKMFNWEVFKNTIRRFATRCCTIRKVACIWDR